MPNEIDVKGLRAKAAAASGRLYEHFKQAARKGRQYLFIDIAGAGETELFGDLKELADAIPIVLNSLAEAHGERDGSRLRALAAETELSALKAKMEKGTGKP
jgi:hypothetical protein